MKKLLSIALALIMLAAITVTAIPAGASGAPDDENILTVTVNGKNPTQVKVGNEFIVRIGLYAGEERILNGQTRMEYDTDYVAFDPYKIADPSFDPDEADEGEVASVGLEYYSFPAKIRNASLVYNHSVPGTINYNFTLASGIAPLNDASKLFARFRFKATASGTTDIAHIIQYMINIKEERIYYKEQPIEAMNPYTVETIEPAVGLKGDIDGDGDVTIMDATRMQRVAAGVSYTYDSENSDVTGDNIVSLKDVVVTRKYLADLPVESAVGTWIFASEA